MSNVLLSISGHDRAGIVRDVAESLLHLNANIEDSSMTALRGRFTMMMIVSLPEDRSLGELKAGLAELERRTRLSVQSQVISDEEASASAMQPDHVITVHGADRVGIVYAVTSALADAGASIVDVSTEQREGEDGSVYMMVLEVAAGGQEGLHEALQVVAERMGVTVEVHSLDDAIL
ncbi:MAG: amino acid-binding protein [Zetaproteobacteria bacterium CG12_big_fil_rev_8_21_14_0_65_54_13]|nr:MAG: amino acid-binding protein [Zetaproteobacteria bacterium CG23_combo_of_CG06-09_8_20_14_all_54_7]PIW49201.1 MAG: amino acid-binding protein [Zetaproteobacteria bacterium CG12_big_fil_rev_8_21_14_0_65_54_13]PIX55468.1 MAG: amino acid-binding protein [Zetaproteobacteria bacterium CG_4_10_14_3_um_filter_54_28]PJA29214.1 MAG: amino acid-binding protein [Zetaproteobacteria bacterium CG_4_9_14_3_um_filter_54_145]